ncbi:hypothetical protein GBA52_023003 [Prunus armeniaca]|nr:hypothetical protein GBA52_023003 [Prunus armeniaca]
MASLSLPKHHFPSVLPTQTPRHNPSSKTLPIVSSSSHSQFYGLKLSNSSSLPIPSSSSSSSSGKMFIFAAKVDKGKVPPAFTLKDQDGKTVSLSKFKGKPVVLYFYPADETPGCTKQACAFRDSYEKFKKAGAQVVGISGDDPSSHKNLAFISLREEILRHDGHLAGCIVFLKWMVWFQSILLQRQLPQYV